VSPMDTILVKIFATALALSEVTIQPRAVRTHLDPVQDLGRRARRSLPSRNADQAIRAARSLTRGLLENYYLPGQLEQSISEFVAYP
jgi:hypothetical protein